MKTTTLRTVGVVAENESWVISERVNDANDAEIAAWERGVQQGVEIGKTSAFTEVMADLIRECNKKAIKAQRASEKLWKYMSKSGIKPKGLYLRVGLHGGCTAMFVLNEEDINELDNTDVYRMKYEIVDKLTRKDFDLDVWFVPYSESFDIGKVKKDGFAFTFKRTTIK